MTKKIVKEEEYNSYKTIQDNAYQIRTEVHQGRKHLVVPVIMMVEGVHSGSRGPLLHLSDELGKVPPSWNGIPITVKHPEENGGLVSANQPHIVDSAVVGRVYHATFENGKLKAEAWLDEDRLRQYSPIALAYIHQQKPLDVSVGVFTDDEMSMGSWNGETYEGIARNHRPDHLALLPGSTGACSWADGCGIRANQSIDINIEQKGGEDDLVNLKEAITLIVQNGGCVSKLLSNGDIGLKDKLNAIQEKLNSMDTLQKVYYLQEAYDGYVIYEVCPRGGVDSSVQFSDSELYKQNYSVNGDGVITFNGDAVQVTKKVEYVVMNQPATLNNIAGGVTMAVEQKKTPCCPEKVTALIQGNDAAFKETDKEWLNLLDCDQLDGLITMAEAAKKDKPVLASMTKEEAKLVLQEQLSDPEKVMGLLPAGVQEQMKHGMNLLKAEKDKLITLITANSKEWTTEELGKESVERLHKLASLIKQPETDYSAFGGNGSGLVAQSEENLLLPPGVEYAKK